MSGQEARYDPGTCFSGISKRSSHTTSNSSLILACAIELKLRQMTKRYVQHSTATSHYCRTKWWSGLLCAAVCSQRHGNAPVARGSREAVGRPGDAVGRSAFGGHMRRCAQGVKGADAVYRPHRAQLIGTTCRHLRPSMLRSDTTDTIIHEIFHCSQRPLNMSSN